MICLRRMFLGCIFAVLIILGCGSAWAAYEIGHTSVTFTDADRGDRAVPAEVYYPADEAGENVPVSSGYFPLLVFSHGWQTQIMAHNPYWKGLVPQGYVMAFPTTYLGSSVPMDGYAADISFLLKVLLEDRLTDDSMFFGHLTDSSALMGYSMGGGASFIAQDLKPLAQTIVAVAPVGTVAGYGYSMYGTNPADAAREVTAPVLIMAGESDCICPVMQHQTRIYNALPSRLKAMVNIMDGKHCGFSDIVYNYGCPSAESSYCPGSTGIPVALQLEITLEYVQMWLDAILKRQNTAWSDFEASATNDTRIVYGVSDPTGPVYPRCDIKADGSDGTVTASSQTPVTIAMSLNVGDFKGLDADWWVAVNTPFTAPGNWYSLVQEAGWKTGVNGYLQGPLSDISDPVTVLNMALPKGAYTFYFALDNPDGLPTGPFLGLDAVSVAVE